MVNNTHNNKNNYHYHKSITYDNKLHISLLKKTSQSIIKDKILYVIKLLT